MLDTFKVYLTGVFIFLIESLQGHEMEIKIKIAYAFIFLRPVLATWKREISLPAGSVTAEIRGQICRTHLNLQNDLPEPL